jgi:hypothetical protein
MWVWEGGEGGWWTNFKSKESRAWLLPAAQLFRHAPPRPIRITGKLQVPARKFQPSFATAERIKY